jgi:hypothetical protein
MISEYPYSRRSSKGNCCSLYLSEREDYPSAHEQYENSVDFSYKENRGDDVSAVEAASREASSR